MHRDKNTTYAWVVFLKKDQECANLDEENMFHEQREVMNEGTRRYEAFTVRSRESREVMPLEIKKIRNIAHGTFGEISLVQNRTGEYFAMKDFFDEQARDIAKKAVKKIFASCMTLYSYSCAMVEKSGSHTEKYLAKSGKMGRSIKQ